MSDERALFDTFARAADGYKREQVIGAVLNLLANTLRQSHRVLGDAEEELDAAVLQVKRMLAQQHYDTAGKRKERRLTLPPVLDLVHSLARRG